MSNDSSGIGVCREHLYDVVMTYVKRCGLVSVTTPKAVRDATCVYPSGKGGCGKPAVLSIYCGEMPRTLEEGDRQALDWIAGRLSAGHRNVIFSVGVKHTRRPLRRPFESPKNS